jgi:hypothetical protein
MVYMWTHMLSISSPDTSRFPPYEELSGAVIPPPIGATERTVVVEVRANILNRAEWLFGFQPGGGEMWDTPLLDIIDAQFREHMQIDGELRPGFGSSHQFQKNMWHMYREGVLKEAGKYIRDQYDAAKASSFLSRLAWFMRDELYDSHRFLPLPTASCLRAVGERLLDCEVGLTEVSMFVHIVCSACCCTAHVAPRSCEDGTSRLSQLGRRHSLLVAAVAALRTRHESLVAGAKTARVTCRRLRRPH